MSKALIKSSRGRGGGVIPAVLSAIIPGVGQLVNGESDKALGVFVVAAVTSVGFLASIPLVGGIAGLVYSVTWIYGVADGYVQGRKKSR